MTRWCGWGCPDTIAVIPIEQSKGPLLLKACGFAYCEGSPGAAVPVSPAFDKNHVPL